MFLGVNLRSAVMEGSNMARVNLRVATIKHGNLKNCDLRAAVLAGADLEVSEKSVFRTAQNIVGKLLRYFPVYLSMSFRSNGYSN